jgi:cytochrome c oxidase subunit 2
MLNWLPENISSFGRDIDGIMYLIYYVVGAWLILAEGVLIYFVVRYRRRPGVKAVHEPGKSMRALAWVVVPTILVFACDLIIDFHGTPAWAKIKTEIPQHDELIRIEGRQFAWNFRHAGKDKQLDTGDDIVTNGRLLVPVNRVVRFELVSKDVLHSFWVPALRLKQDAVPGRRINGWFDTNKTGQFGIGCAELCGNGHGIMAATLFVQADDEYEQWMASH